MSSRVRIVYISRNAHRSERDGRLRGDRNKPAVLKFYGKAALRAAEEDALSNWGGGGIVADVIGALAYKRAPCWSKFHKMQRGGILLGNCWIGRESRKLRPKDSGFVRFLRQQGYDARPKKAQPSGGRNPYTIRFHAPDHLQAAEVEYAIGEVPMPPRNAEPAFAQGPPRLGIWG